MTAPLKNHTTYCSDCYNVSNTSTATANDTWNRDCISHTNHSKHVREISGLCPGVAEYISDQSEPAIFRVSVSDCRRPGYDPRSRHGVVYGVCNDSTTFCQFLVQVPRGMVVRSHLKHSSSACSHNWVTKLANRWPTTDFNSREWASISCRDAEPSIYLSTSDQMFVTHYNSPTLQILFETAMYRLDIVHMSNISGYIIPLAPTGYSLRRRSIAGTLTVPMGHIVMISFGIFKIHHRCFLRVLLQWKEQQKPHLDHKESIAVDFERLVRSYHTSQIKIEVFLTNEIPGDFSTSCLKIIFSYHPENSVPQRLSNALYNCSVDDYWTFQQHLDCNLKVECEDGRDEAEHCPYSSKACQGLVASHNKCYRYLVFKTPVHPMVAADECHRHRLNVSTVKTSQELNDFVNIFQGRSHLPAFFGLFWGPQSVPFMYRHFYIWSDDTILYNANYIHLITRSYRRGRYNNYIKCECPRCDCSRYRMTLGTVRRIVNNVICEKYIQSGNLFRNRSFEFSDPQRSPPAAVQTRQALTVCSEGHVTHAFLSCDLKSRCGQSVCIYMTGITTSKGIMAMFTCSFDDVTIPYTLVCDFRTDCHRGSDESFCKHPVCDGFTCTNGQCVSSDKVCNDFPDCLDDSDERDCPPGVVQQVHTPLPQQQVVINLDGKGYFIQHLINLAEPCPETHYRCRADWIYCLPIYTRCNGLYDCVFHEDERDCKAITCTGLYRCRGSTVCLHVDHLCDGWFQCPQRDDEKLCDVTCPAQCLCQGHAFLCHQPFSAHLFPEIRYLDARGSGMMASDLLNSTYYIIYLSLAECSISALPNMNFHNLQLLDVGNNKMTSIDMNAFLRLENLQVLSLRGNPLKSILIGASHSHEHSLSKLDLSQTRLRVFNNQAFRYFSRLQYINISFSRLQFVERNLFQSMLQLKEIDIRSNMIDTFLANIFNGLNKLSLVRSTDYRLCCKNVLPNVSPPTKCFAPQHFLSSCEYMIQSKVCVLSLWCVAVTGPLSNLMCSAAYYVVKTMQYSSKIRIFLINLQCANFCMGIYTGVITGAHQTFYGEYIAHEDRWKDSVVCKVAGFLALMSGEVSVLIIFLVTLDHLLDLCFPLTNGRFSCRSAALTCAVAWLVGILLASLPLFPGLSHWGHYGQTAVCSLMIHDRHHSAFGFGFIHMVLVLNCFVCLTVSVALVLVYRAMPKYRLLTECSKTPTYMTVELILRITFSDVLSWFLVAITSFLSLAAVAGKDNTNVVMAVMVLPVNSAVNPLLCLWHTLAYTRRQKREERLLRVLKSRIKPTCTVKT